MLGACLIVAQFVAHSPASGTVHGGHRARVRTGHERSRPLVNIGAQCWKACWGQPLKSSNLLSSAMLTCANATSIAYAQAYSEHPSHFLVSVGWPGSCLRWPERRFGPEFYLVTASVSGHEWRAARRESVLGQAVAQFVSRIPDPATGANLALTTGTSMSWNGCKLWTAPTSVSVRRPTT